MATTAYVDPHRGESLSGLPDQRADAGGAASAFAWRLLPILVWLVLAFGAVLAYFALATPLYRASTSVVLDAQGSASEADAAPLSQDAHLVQSQMRLVSSPSVLARVAASQGLTEDPEFNSAAEPLVLSLRAVLGFMPAASPTAPAEQRVVAALAERLEVKRSEGSSIIDIDVMSSDAAKAARLADAVAAAFVDSQNESRPHPVVRPIKQPNPRLREAEERIRVDERRLESLKARSPGLTSGPGAGDREIAELNRTLSQARSAAAAARAKLAQAERAARTGRIPQELGSSMFAALRSDAAEVQKHTDALAKILGPRHPDFIEAQRQLQRIQALIRDELQQVAAGLKRDADLASAAETAALRTLEAKQRELTGANQARADLLNLERELQSDRSAYQQLLAEENAPHQVAPTPSWRVLAPALLPLRPDGPDSRAILLVAAVAGLVLGLATTLLPGLRTRTPTVRRRSPPAERRNLAALPALSAPALRKPVPGPEPDDPVQPEEHVRRFHVPRSAPASATDGDDETRRPASPGSSSSPPDLSGPAPHQGALKPTSSTEPGANSASTPPDALGKTADEQAPARGLLVGKSRAPADLSAAPPRDRYVRRFRIGQPSRSAE